MSDRVRIGTCSGLADAALVRSMFAARGIHVVVGTEHHAGVLTGLGGGFVSLDIWVDEDEQEDATALLDDLRARSASPSDADAGDDDDPGDAGDDERDDADAADDAGDAEHAGDAVHGGASAGGDGRTAADDGETPGQLRLRIDRRRQTAIALLLGACVTFGTAHAFTRAWARGGLLLIIEAIGIGVLVLGNPLGMVAIIGAVVADVTGALWRIHAPEAGARSPLPVARLHER